MEYSQTIGVLKLNTRFPRLPGDIGNPESFCYPTHYCTVQAAVPANITIAETLPDSLQQAFITSAQKLIDQQVSIITTSCGFLSPIQHKLANLSDTPVICSALALLPLIACIHGGPDYLGVLTFNRDTLGAPHLGGVKPGGIEGLLPEDSLRQTIEHDLTELDTAASQTEVLNACNRLLNANPKIRAIVLECTNLSPYKQAIREHTRTSVYDVVDAVHWLIESKTHDRQITADP